MISPFGKESDAGARTTESLPWFAWVLTALVALPIFPISSTALYGVPPIEFTPPASYPTSGLLATFISAADFNNDLAPDLAVVNRGSNSLTIFLNMNDGTGDLLFDAIYPIGPIPRGSEAGDIDGDGDLDLVIANWEIGADSVSILINTGVGAFQPVQILALSVGSRPRVVQLADVDNDGDLDLITVNNGSNSISVLLNPGNGSFGPPVDYPVQLEPGSATTADLNHDGLVDLVVTNRASDSVTILLNQGGGVFNIAVNYLVGNVPRDQAVGDFDNDGDLDIMVVNNAVGGSFSVLLNRGDGSFDPAETFSANGTFPHAIALLDVDQDGVLDAAVGNAVNGAFSILRGRGDGTFLPRVPIVHGKKQIDIEAADFDQDGKLDIATADQTTSASILLNVTIPGACSLGDINGNGVVDSLDLATLLANWGATGTGIPADLNLDGVVNSIDLATLLANWSP